MALHQVYCGRHADGVSVLVHHTDMRSAVVLGGRVKVATVVVVRMRLIGDLCAVNNTLSYYKNQRLESLEKLLKNNNNKSTNSYRI